MITISQSESNSFVDTSVCDTFVHYTSSTSFRPLFFCGDAAAVLQKLPNASVDCAMTSPPYWGHRQYENGGIGLEDRPENFIKHLLLVFHELQRVLKSTGSFWLNIGDTYQNKCLMGIPWRVALAMIDQQGWILRNDVIWNVALEEIVAQLEDKMSGKTLLSMFPLDTEQIAPTEEI